jgi:sodium/pantothenate symporter
LSVVGFTVTQDIFDIKFKDDKDKLIKTRLIMLVVSVAALILAFAKLGSIRIISWFASTMIASSWCVVAFGSVWSKRLSAKGALWAMIAGFFGFMITKCLNGFVPSMAIFYNFIDPFFIGLYLSAIFAVVGSLGSTPSAEEASVLKEMHVIPEGEKSLSDYKRTFSYANALIVVGAIVIIVLIAAWAIPYNEFIASSASAAPAAPAIPTP